MARVPRGGVYVLRDRSSGRIMRTGRTKDLHRRKQEHSRDPLLWRYGFDEIYETEDAAARRGLEQILHERYRPPLDVIAPISAKNPRRRKYLAAARRLLQP